MSALFYFVTFSFSKPKILEQYSKSVCVCVCIIIIIIYIIIIIIIIIILFFWGCCLFSSNLL